MPQKKAYELMDKKVVAVSTTSSILSAMRLFEVSNVDLLPVIDNGKLVGILKDSELLNFALKHDKSELELVSIKRFIEEPVFAEKGESLNEVVTKIIRHNLTRLPVIDSVKSMECIGIISASGLLKSVGGQV